MAEFVVKLTKSMRVQIPPVIQEIAKLKEGSIVNISINKMLTGKEIKELVKSQLSILYPNAPTYMIDKLPIEDDDILDSNTTEQIIELINHNIEKMKEEEVSIDNVYEKYKKSLDSYNEIKSNDNYKSEDLIATILAIKKLQEKKDILDSLDKEDKKDKK